MSNRFTNLFNTPTVNRIQPPIPVNTCTGSSNYQKYAGQVFGNWTRMGIRLVYDSLSRRNLSQLLSGPCYFDQKLFRYHTFESNVLWYLGCLVDAENKSWNPKQKGHSSSTQAYGYFQVISEDVLRSAITTFGNEVTKWNNEKNRTWIENPFFAKSIVLPQWYHDMWDDINNPNLTHYDIIDKWPADIICCILLCTMLSQGKDCDWVELYNGSVDAAKLLYYRGHHADRTYRQRSNKDLLAGIGVNPSVYSNVNSNFICRGNNTQNFIPLVVDKRQRLKDHLHRFFAHFLIEGDSAYDKYVMWSADAVVYNSRSQAEADLNALIDAVSIAVPDGAMILEYPEFYLPLSVGNPDIVLATSMKATSSSELYGFYSPIGDFLSVAMKGDPMRIMATVVHEYGHHANNVRGVVSTASTFLSAVFVSAIFDWDDWSPMDPETFGVGMNAYNQIGGSHIALNSLSNIGSYSIDFVKIDEALVRIKANVAMSDKYKTLDDIYRPKHQQKLFTPKMINEINNFCWPSLIKKTP